MDQQRKRKRADVRPYRCHFDQARQIDQGTKMWIIVHFWTGKKGGKIKNLKYNVHYPITTINQ